MADPEASRPDTSAEVDPEADIIELTHVIEDGTGPEGVIELTEPVRDDQAVQIGSPDRADIQQALEKIIMEQYGPRLDAMLQETIEQVIRQKLESIRKHLIDCIDKS